MDLSDDEYYIDAYNAVKSDDSYINFVINKDINEPWVFNTNPIVENIRSKMKLLNHHSGASCALTLRLVEKKIKEEANVANNSSAPVEEYKKN